MFNDEHYEHCLVRYFHVHFSFSEVELRICPNFSWLDETKHQISVATLACDRTLGLHVTEPLGFKWFYSKSSTKHPVLVQIVTFPVLVKAYHGPPKPTFLEVFMVHSLVFRWPKPLFFMVLGAHGRFILADKSSIDWSPVFGAKGSGLCGGRYRAIEAASMQEECTERWKSTCRFPWALKE